MQETSQPYELGFFPEGSLNVIALEGCAWRSCTSHKLILKHIRILYGAFEWADLMRMFENGKQANSVNSEVWCTSSFSIYSDIIGKPFSIREEKEVASQFNTQM